MPLLRLPRALTPRLYTPRVLRTPQSPYFSRTFTTAPRLLLKEDKERSPEEVEARKQEHLKKQEKGEGGWDEQLASQSESGIAADREEVHDKDKHMEDLQKMTEEKAEKGEM